MVGFSNILYKSVLFPPTRAHLTSPQQTFMAEKPAVQH